MLAHAGKPGHRPVPTAKRSTDERLAPLAGSMGQPGNQPLLNAVLRRGESNCDHVLQQVFASADAQEAARVRFQASLDALSSQMEQSATAPCAETSKRSGGSSRSPARPSAFCWSRWFRSSSIFWRPSGHRETFVATRIPEGAGGRLLGHRRPDAPLHEAGLLDEITGGDLDFDRPSRSHSQPVDRGPDLQAQLLDPPFAALSIPPS
jgi:hypothetical protein